MGDMMAMVGSEEVTDDGRKIDAGGLGRSLIASDPPLHTTMRRLVNRGFTPRVIDDYEPRVREIAEQFVGRDDREGRRRRCRPRPRPVVPTPRHGHRRDARHPGRTQGAVQALVRRSGRRVQPRPRSRPLQGRGRGDVRVLRRGHRGPSKASQGRSRQHARHEGLRRRRTTHRRRARRLLHLAADRRQRDDDEPARQLDADVLVDRPDVEAALPRRTRRRSPRRSRSSCATTGPCSASSAAPPPRPRSAARPSMPEPACWCSSQRRTATRRSGDPTRRPTGSIATPPTTSASGTASTCASARRSLASRPASRQRCCSSRRRAFEPSGEIVGTQSFLLRGCTSIPLTVKPA